MGWEYSGLMTAPTAERLVTAAEFAHMPGPRSGGKMELRRGKVVCMSPVGPVHGERASDIAAILREFARPRRLGRVRVETGYWFGAAPDHVLAPDVSFVSREQAEQETMRDGFVAQPPLLAVEVVSPNDRDTDVAQKVADYLAAGVRRVWVVRPELANVTVHRPGGDAHTYAGDDSLGSDDAAFRVEGFALPLAELFPAPQAP